MNTKHLDLLVKRFTERGAKAAQEILAGNIEAAETTIQERDDLLTEIEALNPDTLPDLETPGETTLICALEQTKKDIQAIKKARNLTGKLFSWN